VAQRSRFLRWPSGDELYSGGVQLCLSVVIALVNVARAVFFAFTTLAIFCAAHNFPGGRKDHERCQSVISVAIALANVV